MRSVSAQKGRIKEKRPFPKQKRFKFVSLRGRSAAVAILKPKVWHPAAKHSVPAGRISNISEIKMVGFIAKPTIFVSLRGRRAAVTILKPKVWHSEPKHGSGKRQNPQISDRHGATPPRCFSGSAISRGRTPAFPVHSIFHTIKDRISPRSHTRLRDEFHCAALPCFVPGCRLVPSKIAASGAKMRPPRNDKSDRVCRKTKRFSERNV